MCVMFFASCLREERRWRCGSIAITWSKFLKSGRMYFAEKES